jgi:hypothetical protein
MNGAYGGRLLLDRVGIIFWGNNETVGAYISL